MPQTNFSSRDFRDAMGRFASGVVIISTTTPEEGHHAMTANAFMSGSLTPPLVVVSVVNTARMHARIQHAGWFGISVLSQAQSQTSNHFAGRSSGGGEVEPSLPQFEMLAQVPVIAGAVMQLEASLCHAYACGDHTLFVGEVKALRLPQPGEPPLLYHGGRYGRLIQ